MRTRAFRTVGLLFGLSLMLTACDPGSLLDLFAGFLGTAETPAAEEEAPAETPAEVDPVSTGSEPDPVGDESDPVSDESDPVSDESEPEEESPEHNCFRNGNGGGAQDEADEAPDFDADAAGEADAEVEEA